MAITAKSITKRSEEIRKVFNLDNGSIIRDSISTDYHDFIDYIDRFCEHNKIHIKFVGESIAVYPADYNDINRSRIGDATTWISLVGWDIERHGHKITQPYWVSDEAEEINSFDDLEALLFRIHNSKQALEAYYTQEEIDERAARNAESTRVASVSPIQHKINLLTKIESLGITEADLAELITLNKYASR